MVNTSDNLTKVKKKNQQKLQTWRKGDKWRKNRHDSDKGVFINNTRIN